MYRFCIKIEKVVNCIKIQLLEQLDFKQVFLTQRPRKIDKSYTYTSYREFNKNN